MPYVKNFMAIRLGDPIRPELVNKMFSSIEEEFKFISKAIAMNKTKAIIQAEEPEEPYSGMIWVDTS